MSVKITTWAWDQAGLDCNQKLVLIALADWCDPDGVCFPSKEAIAEKTGLSKRTVDAHVAALIAAGLVAMAGTHKRRDDGRGGRNRYIVGPGVQILHPGEQADTVAPGCKSCTPAELPGVQPTTIPGCNRQQPYKVEPPLEPSVQQNTQLSGGSSGSSQDPEKTFQIFWQAYPAARRECKKEALQVWMRLRPDAELLAKILKALEVQKKAKGWDNPPKDRVEFIPHARRWLHGRRWEDEIQSTNQGVKGKYDDLTER